MFRFGHSVAASMDHLVLQLMGINWFEEAKRINWSEASIALMGLINWPLMPS